MLGYLQMWHFPHKWGTKANLIYWKEPCSQHKSWDQSAWMLALSSEWYRTYWTNQAGNNLSSSMLNKSIASHFLHYYWILLTAGFVPSFKCVLIAEWSVQEVFFFFAVGLRKQGHRWLFFPRRSRHLFGNKLILSHYNFLLAISWTMLFSMILKKILAGGSEYF